MSTRAHLRFVPRTDDDSTADRVSQVYVHMDGYPGAVVTELRDLVRLLSATHTQRGPQQAAAQYLLLGSLYTFQLYVGGDSVRSIDADAPADVLDPKRIAQLDQPQFLRGHAITDPRHGIVGDEEFLYVVEVPDGRRAAANPFETWHVRVSEHCGFPHREGPTRAAFEHAAWQFEGSLKDAIATFVLTG